MLPKLLPHFFGGRGRGVADSAKRGGRFERIEVFHSIKTMLRRPHRVVCREDRSRIGTKKLDLKSNCDPNTA